MENNKAESSESEKRSEIELEKQTTDSTNSSDTQSQNPLVGVILLIVLFPAIYYVGGFIKNIRFKSRAKAHNKVVSLINSAIPKDGIYGKDESLGGEYIDPIHNFFTVQPPQDCEIKANKLEKTFKIPKGPNAGKIVPVSRVLFFKDDYNILVKAGKTFIPEADDDWLRESSYMKGCGTSFRSRWITIDGAKGNEHIFWAPKDFVTHVVQYKKNSLKHIMVLVCKRKEFKEIEKEFQEFVKSYLGLRLE